MLYYVFLISILTLILTSIILLTFIITKKSVSRTFIKILSICLILALSIIAYCIQPKITNDLYKHFESINYIRIRGFTQFKTYDAVIGAKILFYIISLTNNNHWLSVASVLVTYGIFFYMINDFCKYNKVNMRTIAIAIFLNFSMCTFSTVASGVRNSMAFAFIALSLYWDLIKGEKGVKILCLYLIAVTIHPSSWIIICIRLLLLLKKISQYKYVLLFWGVTIKYIIKILYFFNTSITIYIGRKLQGYFYGEWIDDMRLFYVSIVLVIGIYIITYMARKYKQMGYNKYITFLQIYLLIILGSIFVAKIFMKRLLILLAFFMIPLVYIIEKNFEKNKKIIVYTALMVFMCGLIPYSIIEVRGNMGLIFNR